MTKTGFAGIAAVFVLGGWLIAAPFALRFQPAGAHWVPATQTCVVTGAILAAAAFAAFFVALTLHVRSLYDRVPLGRLLVTVLSCWSACPPWPCMPQPGGSSHDRGQL